MKRVFVAILLMVCAVGLPFLRADEAKARHVGELQGTWRLISTKYGNASTFKDFPKTSILLKHITATQFSWVNYDAVTKKIIRAGGGSYTLDGDKYVEHLEYGLGNDIIPMIGQDQAFTDKVDGDKLDHAGTLSSGVKIAEVYERVREADRQK